MNTIHNITSRASLRAIIFCIASFSLASGQNKGLSILVIGDSNTEHGFITLALADTLREYFRVDSMGTGYLPFDSSFYAVRYGRYAGVAIAYDATSWTRMDMNEGTRLAIYPYPSPNGQWLKSSTVNAAATLTCPGNGIDVYWLSQSLGGSFSIAIDNIIHDTINTAGSSSVQKTSITGLAAGRHTVTVTVISVPAHGGVSLLGFDARKDRVGQTKRTVVHNWGNGYGATSDFLKIDSTIFVAGLQKLAPDAVVVVLGTNDYYIDQRSAPEFKTNLKALINRVKASGAVAKILLVSTFMTNDAYGPTYLPLYQAASWPEAASETGIEYWDMCAWFGPYKAAYMNGSLHCNAAGGRLIADEMLRQILLRFPSATIRENQIKAPSLPGHEIRCMTDKIILTQRKNRPYRIDLITTTGRFTACLQGVGSHLYRFGEGKLALHPGGYVGKLNLDGRVYGFHFVVMDKSRAAAGGGAF